MAAIMPIFYTTFKVVFFFTNIMTMMIKKLSPHQSYSLTMFVLVLFQVSTTHQAVRVLKFGSLCEKNSLLKVRTRYWINTHSAQHRNTGTQATVHRPLCSFRIVFCIIIHTHGSGYFDQWSLCEKQQQNNEDSIICEDVSCNGAGVFLSFGHFIRRYDYRCVQFGQFKILDDDTNHNLNQASLEEEDIII